MNAIIPKIQLVRTTHFFDNLLIANNIMVPASADGQNLLKKKCGPNHFPKLVLANSYGPTKYIPINPSTINTMIDVHNK
jgi:hypothetical protein